MNMLFEWIIEGQEKGEVGAGSAMNSSAILIMYGIDFSKEKRRHFCYKEQWPPNM